LNNYEQKRNIYDNLVAIFFLTINFRNSSMPKSRIEKGIKKNHMVIGMGEVPTIALPGDVYIISIRIIISNVIPQIINLLFLIGNENAERNLDLQTRTFAIWVTIIPVRHTVVAFKYRGSKGERVSPHFQPLRLRK